MNRSSMARKRVFQIELIHRLITPGCLVLIAFELFVSSSLLPLSELNVVHALPREQIMEIGISLCDDMKHAHVLDAGGPLGCDRLRLVKFDYFGFDGGIHQDGRIIVMDAAAENVLDIFNSLAKLKFPIAQTTLMQAYGGNDDASMADNNTSAFNNRQIKGGGDVSLHAYGLALDINPIQNPYVKVNAGKLEFSPPAGIEYVDRRNRRPGMAEAAIDILANNGFLIWGGDWSNPVDYQHFQVGREFARTLARLSPQDAKVAFKKYVLQCQSCLRTSARPKCVEQISSGQTE